MENFHTSKMNLDAELARALKLNAEKTALEVDSAEWDAWTDFDSAASVEIRGLNESLTAFEHEQIYQHGIGRIEDATYQELRKLLKSL